MLLPLLYLLPRRQISRLTGFIVHLKWPDPLRLFLLRAFVKKFQIQMAEAEKPLEAYSSIGDLFIRRLKQGLRPLGDTFLVHPADSVITQAELLSSGVLIQAKGKTYNLKKFLGEADLPGYRSGAFVTYYLCPTDYHRLHSPATGTISRVVYLPGDLWPVNEWSTTHVDEVFCLNERVVVEIQTERGPLAAAFVGATNVGEISLAFWPEFRARCKTDRRPFVHTFDTPLSIQKGDELGAFHMGSTLVLCVSGSILAKENWAEIPRGKPVAVCGAWNQAR